MNYKFLSFVLAFMVLLGVRGLAEHAEAASPGVKAVKLEHIAYPSARRVILSSGWRPVSGPCEQVGEETCARYPEIEGCTGVGSPNRCGMAFRKQGRCLYIGTTGEPDGDFAGVRVDGVTFRPGPCSKH